MRSGPGSAESEVGFWNGVGFGVESAVLAEMKAGNEEVPQGLL